MKIKTTVVCLPVQNLDQTLIFYKNVFGLSDLTVDEGIITLELPSLSLFLMEKEAFELYSKKAGLGIQFPDKNIGTIISCAVVSKEDVDTSLEKASNYGGSVRSNATIDGNFGGYIGYISDPDGHIWELVFPQQKR